MTKSEDWDEQEKIQENVNQMWVIIKKMEKLNDGWNF